jgi:uncharacterized protein
MSEHPNAAVVRRSMEAMEAGDLETAASLVADDVVWHEIGRSEPRRGIDELRASMGEVDYTIDGRTHDILATDDHVVLLIDATATRNGRTFDYKVAEVYHIRDGKIAERWAVSDDTARIAEFFA